MSFSAHETRLVSRTQKVARDYQREAFEIARNQNAIIHITTGGGKTLIALFLIDHFLRAQPGKKIVFVAPTKELVTQQSDAVQRECTESVNVLRLQGNAAGSRKDWDAAEWRNQIERSNVIVGTPEIIRRAMSNMGALRVESVSFIIFDECHHCHGSSSMGQICHFLKQAKGPSEPTTGPRVLGLTASFATGSIKNLEQDRQDLETLLDATLFAFEDSTSISGGHEQTAEHGGDQGTGSVVGGGFPSSAERRASLSSASADDGIVDEVEDAAEHGEPFGLPADDSALLSRNGVECVQVEYDTSVTDDHERTALTIEVKVKEVIEKFDSGFGVSIKHPTKLAAAAKHVYLQCGYRGFQFYLSEVLLEQLKEKADEAAGWTRAQGDLVAAEMWQQNAKNIRRHYVEMQADLRSKAAAWRSELTSSDQERGAAASSGHGGGSQALESSKKFARLLQLCRELLLGEEAGHPLCIIFVQQAAVLEPMRHQLEAAGHRVGTIAGRNKKAGKGSAQVLEKFRSGGINLLVATAVAEEGIDVPECNYVIRYDEVRTAKSHIQGSGRARAANARIFSFVTDLQEMEDARHRMQKVAQDRGAGVSEASRALAVQQHQARIFPGVHPWQKGDEKHRRGQRRNMLGAQEESAEADVGVPVFGRATASGAQSPDAGGAVASSAQRSDCDELDFAGPPSGASSETSAISATAAESAHTHTPSSSTPVALPPGRGVLDVANALNILHEYAQKVLTQSIPEDRQYEYQTGTVREHPHETRKTLASIMVPTPDGEKRITRQDVDEFWGDVTLAMVVDWKVLTKWKTADQDKRRFAYVAAVFLSWKWDCLDEYNRPTERAKRATRWKCGPYELPSGVNIRASANRTTPQQAGGARTAANGTSTNTNPNYRGLLESWLRRQGKPLDAYEISTKATALGGMFKATIHILEPNGGTVVGEAKAKKKDAEASAVKKALVEKGVIEEDL